MFTGFLIRLDDIAENMDWVMMEKASNLFDKFQVKPIIGIIPNNKDPELLNYPKKNIQFWNQVRAWKQKGWKIAMHGNNHVYDKFCSKTDYLGIGGNSEFCDHTFENQYKKLKELLESKRIQIAKISESSYKHIYFLKKGLYMAIIEFPYDKYFKYSNPLFRTDRTDDSLITEVKELKKDSFY